MMKIKVFAICLFLFVGANAQTLDDRITVATIHTVQIFQRGDQWSYPVMSLGADNALEFHFDDFGNQAKNYSYTYQLCNADWTPSNLNAFDFIKGFTQTPIRQYRNSSVTKTRYVHYQGFFPDAGSRITKSGNYILKVFLNGDTSKLAFTKRFLVVDNTISVGAQVLQPFNPQYFRTHQRLQFTIDKSKLNMVNPAQQLKVVIMQNYDWRNAVTGIQPTFIRNNLLEYSNENLLTFPGTSEYRWADLRSFRFQSERIKEVKNYSDTFHVFLRPDVQSGQRYYFNNDKNGFYEIASSDLANGFWQGEYGWVHFAYKPLTLETKNDFYVGGQFNNYEFSDEAKLKFNPETSMYETALWLKQGYYTYNFFSGTKGRSMVPVSNFIETENDYTILVYYRSLSGRHDELIGFTSLNSRNLRNGF